LLASHLPLHSFPTRRSSDLSAQFADLFNRLQHANFIIGGHDRHEDCLVVEGSLQIIQINQPVLLHWQISHAIAVLLQPLAGIEQDRKSTRLNSSHLVISYAV